jgi:hypothetical protein
MATALFGSAAGATAPRFWGGFQRGLLG